MELFKSYIQRLAKERNVDALIEVLKDPGWSTSRRLAAISALGEISNPQAVEALTEALKDSDSRVRQTAVATLGQLGYTHAMESLAVTDEIQSALLAVAQQDWDRAVSLGSAALEPLVAALKDNKKYWVHQRVVTALGQLGDPGALEPLVVALTDNDSEVRYRAATALGQLGNPGALEPLVTVLRDNASGARQRAAVATALGHLGDSRALEPLVAVLEDRNSEARHVATAALGQLGDSRALESLVAALKDNEDKWMRYRAAAALGQLEDSRALEPLMVALNDNANEVR